MPTQKKLLFFSLEDWDCIWRRNQFVVSLLLQRHPDLEVLWINSAKDAWRNPGYLPLIFSKGQIAESNSRLHVLPTIKLLPNILGEELNNWATSLQIRRALRALDWNSWTTWANDSVAAKIIGHIGRPELLIYDITDDWLKSDLPQRNLQRLSEADDWLCRQADSVIVCSQDLFNTRKEKAKTIRLIPNGVHFDLYKPEALAKLQPPPESAGITQPVAGYVGTLHEDRLDMDLLLSSAARAPSINFVFVGPNCLHPDNTQRLSARGNIHLLGPRPYEMVPSYLSWFDICMVPHRVTPFTDSLDPLKLYEFMATGKPIVATACAGFRDLAPLVTLADTSNFAEKLLAAQADGADQSAKRVAWARDHSWEKRITEIESVLGWNT